MREHGTKNELNDVEKTSLESLINSSWINHKIKIHSQLGVSGARTSTYLVTDEKEQEYALKIPNDFSDKNWINDIELYDKCDQVFNGFKGAVLIPKIITSGGDDKFNYRLENYLGSDLTIEFYNGLSKDKQEQIAIDIAEFLVFLHKDKNTKKLKEFLYLCNKGFDSLLQIFKDFISEEEQLYLENKINEFNTRDANDEVETLAHGDIRSQNILYNDKTSKIAVIDYDMFSNWNIYHDFVPFAAASYGLSYDLLFNIVDKYNDLSDFKINKEKVKLLHILGVLHEYGRCAIDFNLEKDDIFNSKNRMFRAFNEIEKAYLNNLENQKPKKLN